MTDSTLNAMARLGGQYMSGPPAAALCPACSYVHADDEPCWWDGCRVCGGTYTMGPSTSDICTNCAQGEEVNP